MKIEEASMLKRCFRRTVRYGYFAPLQALYLSLKKPGGFILHWRAIYRLRYWNKDWD